MKIIVLLVCSLLCSLLTSSVFEAFAALEDDLRNTAILTRQNMRTTPRTYVRHGNGNRKKDIISLRNATATTVPFPDLFAGRIIGLESAQHFEIERYSIRGSAKKSSYLQNIINILQKK